MKTEKKFFILSVCGVVLALALILGIVYVQNHGDITSNISVTEKSDTQKASESIAIPGYELLELDANRKAQTLCLSNPSSNECCFRISLYLENEVLLWRSGLIEPGKTSEPIILNQVLKKGTYTNAVLKYDCYKMDGKTPLNGAETKLTLRVK